VRARAEPTREKRRDTKTPRTPPRRAAAPDDDDFEEFDEDEFDDAEARWTRRGGGGPPSPPPPRRGWLDAFGWQGGSVTGALTAAAFALGIGAGVAFDTVVTLDRDNVASSGALLAGAGPPMPR